MNCYIALNWGENRFFFLMFNRYDKENIPINLMGDLQSYTTVPLYKHFNATKFNLYRTILNYLKEAMHSWKNTNHLVLDKLGCKKWCLLRYVRMKFLPMMSGSVPGNTTNILTNKYTLWITYFHFKWKY